MMSRDLEGSVRGVVLVLLLVPPLLWDPAAAQALTLRERLCMVLVDRGLEELVPRVLIEGRVFRSDTQIPIPGAVVSTSLDSETATTDEGGRFCLVTRTFPHFCCHPYTITISASGFETFSGTEIWGDRPTGQEFFLTPIP